MRNLRSELPDDLQNIPDRFEVHCFSRMKELSFAEIYREKLSSLPIITWQAFLEVVQAQFSGKYPQMLSFIDGLRGAQNSQDVQRER